MHASSKDKIKHIIQVCAVLLSLTACTTETPATSENRKSLKQQETGYKLSFEEVLTESNLSGLEFYNIFGVKVQNDTAYYFGYNKKKHKLDVFFLTPGKKWLDYELPLEREGPDGITDIQALLPINHEDIVVIEEFGIKILNKYGKVKESIKLLTTKYAQEYQYKATYNTQPHYSATLNSLYFNLHSLTVSGYANPQAYFKTKAFGSVSLDSKQAEPILNYPESYQKDYYGYMNEPNLRGDDNKIIYTFPADPKVYQFDVAQNEMIVYDIKPMYTSEEVPPLTWNDSRDDGKKMMHYMQSPIFSTAIIFDKIIVRFYRSGISRDQIEPGMSVNKKKAYISILDIENGIYQDFKLSTSNLALEKAFTTPDAIWIPFFIEGPEGTLKFQKISISKTQ